MRCKNWYRPKIKVEIIYLVLENGRINMKAFRRLDPAFMPAVAEITGRIGKLLFAPVDWWCETPHVLGIGKS